jgi:hypothetical protein
VHFIGFQPGEAESACLTVEALWLSNARVSIMLFSIMPSLFVREGPRAGEDV